MMKLEYIFCFKIFFEGLLLFINFEKYVSKLIVLISCRQSIWSKEFDDVY